MKDLILKSFNYKNESFKDDDEYCYFEGYASTFGNTDRGGDVVQKGAFTASLTKMMPKMIYQHNMREPIGVYTEIKEDAIGLYVKGKMPKGNRLSADVYALLKCGAIDSMSIGFTIDDYTQKDGITYLDKLTLWEISLVTIPMNEMAKITNVKSNEGLVKDFSCMKDIENFLKDPCPLNGKNRKILISKIKEFSDARDADHEEATPGRDVGNEGNGDESIINQKLDEILTLIKTGE